MAAPAPPFIVVGLTGGRSYYGNPFARRDQVRDFFFDEFVPFLGVRNNARPDIYDAKASSTSSAKRFGNFSPKRSGRKRAFPSFLIPIRAAADSRAELRHVRNAREQAPARMDGPPTPHRCRSAPTVLPVGIG